MATSNKNMKFKEGDYAKINKCKLKKNVHGTFSKTCPDYYWTPEMDVFNQSIIKVTQTFPNGVLDKNNNFFVNDWLQKPTKKEKSHHIATKI